MKKINYNSAIQQGLFTSFLNATKDTDDHAIIIEGVGGVSLTVVTNEHYIELLEEINTLNNKLDEQCKQKCIDSKSILGQLIKELKELDVCKDDDCSDTE